MATIGDVLGVVAFLLGLGLTTWAMNIAAEVLFPNRVHTARLAVWTDTKGTILRGLLYVVLMVVPSIALLSVPNPLVKLLGWVLLLALLGFGSIGCAGLSRHASGRLQEMDPSMNEYAAFIRGSAILVAASMFPILGWFLFAPVLFITSVGAGARALRRTEAASPSLTEAI